MELANVLDADALEELEDDLLARAFLYETPQTYRDAVEEVFEALRAQIARRIASRRTVTA